MAVHEVPVGAFVEGDPLRVAAVALAREFHDTYEGVAVDQGYATRQETRSFDPGSANGRTMVGTVAALLAAEVIVLGDGAAGVPLFGSTHGAAGAAGENGKSDARPGEVAPGVVPSGLAITRMVVFRSRTGAYDVPAVVTATVDTLNPAGVAAFHASGHAIDEWEAARGDDTRGASAEVTEEWEKTYPRPALRGVPPLSSPSNVHLTVLTPGLPGRRGSAADFLVPPAHGLEPMENAGGSYQEFDVPWALDAPDDVDAAVAPGTWRWPERK